MTKAKTAIAAGRLVMPPATRKVSAAPGAMPIAISSPIRGIAAKAVQVGRHADHGGHGDRLPAGAAESLGDQVRRQPGDHQALDREGQQQPLGEEQADR